VDLRKLSLGDKIIAASAIVLFIAYFLPWFEASSEGDGLVGEFSATFNGSDVNFAWGTLPMLIGLVMLGIVVASRLFDVRLPALPIPWGQALLAAGALAAVLVIIKLIIGEDDDAAAALGIDVSRSFGIFLAALAALGLAVGGYFKSLERDDTSSTMSDPPGNAPF